VREAWSDGCAFFHFLLFCSKKGDAKRIEKIYHSLNGGKGAAAVAKNKYDTHVLPRLSDIEQWAKAGLSEKQIANKLGIAYSTWNVYKGKYTELSVEWY